VFEDRRGTPDAPAASARAELADRLAEDGLSEREIEQLSPFLEYYAEQQVYTLLRNGFVVFAVLAAVLYPVVWILSLVLGVLAVLVGVAVAMQVRPYRRAQRLRADVLANPQRFLNGEHDWEEIEAAYD